MNIRDTDARRLVDIIDGCMKTARMEDISDDSIRGVVLDQITELLQITWGPDGNIGAVGIYPFQRLE